VFGFARAMTSTALVEIIDLTEAHTPIDNGIQKVPKSENYETDADPEKSTTRAVRNRKNGGASRARSHPVKSRDGSVERGYVQSGEATESQLAEDVQGRDGESTRKKKRRSKKGKLKDGDSSPSSREDTQRDAAPALDDGQLFFIDTEPASVPTDMAFLLKDDTKDAPSYSQAVEDNAPLLLPQHVSVLDAGDGTPVKIVQPADSDSDSESYIEYLDYDDRLVRR
jgi:protein AIR1/2